MQWSPMKAAGDPTITEGRIMVEATITKDIIMVAPVPEDDGTKVVTTGETQEAIEMDGELGIADAADD